MSEEVLLLFFLAIFQMKFLSVIDRDCYANSKQIFLKSISVESTTEDTVGHNLPNPVKLVVELNF